MHYCNLSAWDIHCRFYAFKRLASSEEAQTLFRHALYSKQLDWLELVYATLRRRTDHSCAAKNCNGILWRGMCLSPKRSEKMKYRLLPCELCIFMESLEQVLGVWDVKPFSDASYPKAQFVWRKSLPCKTDQGL